MPRQHSTGFQRVPVENPFRCRFVAIGAFWEDGTSLAQGGGASVVEDIRMFTTGCLTPRLTPRILLYLSESPSTPTWAPDPAKGLVQHYMSLQGWNSCTGSSSLHNLALLCRPAILLASGTLGRLLHAWNMDLLDVAALAASPIPL